MCGTRPATSSKRVTDRLKKTTTMNAPQANKAHGPPSSTYLKPATSTLRNHTTVPVLDSTPTNNKINNSDCCSALGTIVFILFTMLETMVPGTTVVVLLYYCCCTMMILLYCTVLLYCCSRGKYSNATNLGYYCICTTVWYNYSTIMSMILL